MHGIKHVQGAMSSTRLPVTDPIMLLLFKSLNLKLSDHCMFWAPRILAFFGFPQASEFLSNRNSFSPSCHLMKDIAFDSLVTPSLLRVNIKVSKTDPFRHGTAIHIGRGHYPLCAIQVLATYLAAQGDGPGPLFRFQSGQPLSRTVLTSWLREILATADVSGNFSSHSFCIGAATVAAQQGIPDHLIRALGRWTSNAYPLYIHTPAKALASLSSQLCSRPASRDHHL